MVFGVFYGVPVYPAQIRQTLGRIQGSFLPLEEPSSETLLGNKTAVQFNIFTKKSTFVVVDAMWNSYPSEGAPRGPNPLSFGWLAFVVSRFSWVVHCFFQLPQWGRTKCEQTIVNK